MKSYLAAISLGALALACRVCRAEVPPVPDHILHTSDIADLARFSPNGKLLAIETESEPLSTDMTRSVELWDTATWQRLRIIRSSQSYLNFDVFFSSDSRILFTRSTRRVEQWDLSTSQNRNIYGGGDFFAVSQDRRFFAGRSFQNTEQSVGLHQKRLTAWVRLIDTTQHKLATAIILPLALYNWAGGVFSPDDSILAVDADDQGGSLTLWDTKTGTQIPLGNGAAGAEQSAFSPDGKMFATVGAGLPLTFWNTSAWNKIRSCPMNLKWADAISFSATGKRLFISGDDGTGTRELGHTLTLWDVGLGKVIQQVPHQYGTKFSDDGRLLMTQGDKTVTLWNAETGKKLLEYSSQSDYLLPFALSPDNHVLATMTSRSREVSIWNIPSQ